MPVDNNVVNHAGGFVDAFFKRNVVDQVNPFDTAGFFGNDRNRKRIPFGNLLTFLDLGAFGYQNLGAVRNFVAGFSRSLPSTITISQLRDNTIIWPSELVTVWLFSSFRTPANGTSTVDCSADLEAAPPMWKVLIVSWVPGSPID